jgi:hypothetical protein
MVTKACGPQQPPAQTISRRAANNQQTTHRLQSHLRVPFKRTASNKYQKPTRTAAAVGHAAGNQCCGVRKTIRHFPEACNHHNSGSTWGVWMYSGAHLSTPLLNTARHTRGIQQTLVPHLGGTTHARTHDPLHNAGHIAQSAGSQAMAHATCRTRSRHARHIPIPSTTVLQAELDRYWGENSCPFSSLIKHNYCYTA